MGLHQDNPFSQYFSCDKSSNKSVCNIEGCRAEIAGNHGGNLQRHIQRRHPAEYTDSTSNKRPANVTADGQTTLDAVIVKKPKTTGLHIQMNPDVLKEACIELVTLYGRPFTLMEDTGFREIIEPIQEVIGNDFTNSSNIRDMVSSVAQSGREKHKRMMAKEKESTTVKHTCVSISSVLDMYSREARLKRSECLFKYWASVAPTNPDLHKLAMNVMTLPVTQVSVELAFSCLKYILSPLRSSMNAQVLEDILFVRLNKQYGL